MKEITIPSFYDYLQETAIVVHESELKKFIFDNKNDMANELIGLTEEYLNKENNYLHMDGINYHLYHLQLFNTGLLNIYSHLNEIMFTHLDKKLNTQVLNALIDIKRDSYEISFNLPYQQIFNETYSIDFIPSHKRDSFLKEI